MIKLFMAPLQWNITELVGLLAGTMGFPALIIFPVFLYRRRRCQKAVANGALSWPCMLPGWQVRFGSLFRTMVRTWQNIYNASKCLHACKHDGSDWLIRDMSGHIQNRACMHDGWNGLMWYMKGHAETKCTHAWWLRWALVSLEAAYSRAQVRACMRECWNGFDWDMGARHSEWLEHACMHAIVVAKMALGPDLGGSFCRIPMARWRLAAGRHAQKAARTCAAS